MAERIVLAGASGFIGSYLADAFRAEGAEVVFIGRSGADASWGDTARITELLDGSALLINMAGKSVDCRYTEANRAEIIRSRTATTTELARALRDCAAPPPLWVNASTATIYRHAEDRPMTDETGEIGTGFSVEVAKAWEAALFAEPLPATRRVALRMAIVLGDGSALAPLIRLAQFGLGGAQLDGHWPISAARRRAGTGHAFRARGGRQRFSWIHIADVLGVIRFLRDRPDLDGTINASSPNPVDSRTLMAALRRVLGMPIGIPTPRWVLEIGAFAIRTETELILKSRWVVPTRLQEAGYRFAYPEIEPALRQIVEDRRAARKRAKAALTD
ncbi:epimerase [Amnibacterium flavum]|uniref:NAD-dependent epimerase n=1 Tax=Amnibacterium flavum TaxID=2173173 RepID=A0A2V1HV38_9MICO|nr:DUF1731 domain-containing protein [Amnibacterium flavum]PVZ93964.1 NAD-dependent epimerase [Amnibacterium flavum]